MKVTVPNEKSAVRIQQLVSTAIQAANSQTVSGVERCFSILRCLKSFNFTFKDLDRHSHLILVLQSLRTHQNPKVLMAANVLFNSWLKPLYRDPSPSSSTCNKTIPLKLKKSEEFATKTQFLRLKKSEDETSKARETRDIKQTDDCNKAFGTRPLQTKSRLTATRLQVFSKSNNIVGETNEIKQDLKMSEDVTEPIQKKKMQTAQRMKLSQNPRSGAHETQGIKQNLKKQTTQRMKLSQNPRSRAHETQGIKQNLKKQTTQRMKLSQNPRFVAHETQGIKQNLKKQQPAKVSQNLKHCPVLEKNSMEMLELFDIAKKSADVANAKGLLAAKAETAICVDTLSLLISFPISSIATETRKIMERLERLTKHKDRKICSSASELLYRWSQSIRGQQQRHSRKNQD